MDLQSNWDRQVCAVHDLITGVYSDPFDCACECVRLTVVAHRACVANSATERLPQIEHTSSTAADHH